MELYAFFATRGVEAYCQLSVSGLNFTSRVVVELSVLLKVAIRQKTEKRGR